MAGFAIAGMLIMLSVIFNDYVLTPEDVENKVGLKVLASLPMDEEEEL